MMLLRTLRREDSGNAMVEFAFSVSILLLLLFGILDLCRAVYVNHFVAGAARDGSRYAMVRGSAWNGSPCAP